MERDYLPIEAVKNGTDRLFREQVLRYAPHIYRDRLEPFPIRFVGCTVFTRKAPSESFPKWVVDPEETGARMIIEYAVFYDYDIGHMYDLEHIWVAVDAAGGVADCWCSFHGMRLRAFGLSVFRMEGTHPVLYAQPGKHAMLPHPALFELHPEFHTACTSGAGGGLLLPGFLAGTVETNDVLDSEIARFIRSRYAFTPSLEFVQEELCPGQFISWPELLQRIPQRITNEIQKIHNFFHAGDSL